MMENATYVGLSHQMALLRHMDIIANNIANMNTTAFRAEQPIFEEFPMPSADRVKVSFVLDRGLLRNLDAGEITRTDNPLDVAINGPGYFVVETEVGPRYTRDGHFRVDDEGRLISNSGWPVLDDGGQVIVFDVGAKAPTINRDGTIATELGVIGRIGVVRFANEQRLLKQGGGLYSSAQEPEPVEKPSIVQGMIEKSNVEPIIEITRMIEVMRAYQSTQKLMDTGHDLQRRAIDKPGRVSAG